MRKAQMQNNQARIITKEEASKLPPASDAFGCAVPIDMQGGHTTRVVGTIRHVELCLLIEVDDAYTEGEKRRRVKVTVNRTKL